MITMSWPTYVTTDAHHAPLLGDEPEPIEVVPWPLDRLADLIQVPECSEARTLAALFMTREHLLREGRS